MLSRSALSGAVTRRLVSILNCRVEARKNGELPLISSYALEGLLRAAISGTVSKHRVLGALGEVTDSEDPIFALHAAKLAGISFQLWNDQEMLVTLDRLCGTEASTDEALVELGLCHLKCAFSKSDRGSVIRELSVVRQFLLKAMSANEEREDAIAYRSAVDIVLGFATDAPSNEIDKHAAELKLSVSRWLAWRERELIPPWLKAREDSDLQWASLVSEVPVVAEKINRQSWLNASAVLERILAVYDAERFVGVGPGLKVIVSPRIEAAFLRTSGLRAHLNDALDSGVLEQIPTEVAQSLRERICALAAGASPGKANGDGRYPRLMAVL